MEFQEIQDKLNALLIGEKRKVVFWYDDDAGYAEDVDNLQLGEKCKLWKLTEGNQFATKLQIEEREPDVNFLVYAPFARPEDKGNHLADTFYYAEHFYSDKLVQLSGDLGIPAECMDEVRKYKKFWTSGNVSKFRKLQIADYTPDNVDLGILCVLAGVKANSIEELSKATLLAGFNDNAILKKMEYYKIDTMFWRFIEKQYGYLDESPTLEKFFVTLIVTYTDVAAGGDIPGAWKTFLSPKTNDAVVFVKNLMNNAETAAFYDDAVEMVSSKLKVETAVKEMALSSVAVCDTFMDFDENLIAWMIAKIEDDMLDEKIAGMTIPEIALSRLKPCYHFSGISENWYQTIYHAYNVIKNISLHTFQPTLQEVIEDYAESTYEIDTHYRKFYYYMDRLGLQENVEKIRDLVENNYTNKYLSDFTYKWNNILTDDAYNTYPGNRESEFFEGFVKPFMREDGKEGRVIIIISDGMRYECARELFENLEMDEKCDAKIDYMLSVLPSETTLGMASLLPHKDIVVSPNLEIKVDGETCGNEMAARQKILQQYEPNSACYKFDVVMKAKQDELREMLQDKTVVYIYQDQIDARGEKMPLENEVFNACQEAIEEIQTLIRRLTGYVSNTRYLVTADHGFIYKRDKLVESDKISLEKTAFSFKNKRYLLSAEPAKNDALISRTLAYLSKMNEIFVSTPKGADIIKTQGGGQNYVHGGSSLQEMVVPVLKVKTFKGKQDTGTVSVELSSFHNRITEATFKLEFMQMEPVTDTVKPRSLVAFFVDGSGSKISFDVPIIANVRDTDARQRRIVEKFTLKSGKYTRGHDYFHVLADMDDERKEYRRYKFEIDIADM